MVCLCCTLDEEKQVSLCLLFCCDYRILYNLSNVNHSCFRHVINIFCKFILYRKQDASCFTINVVLALLSAVTTIMMACAGDVCVVSFRLIPAIFLVKLLILYVHAFLADASRRRHALLSFAAIQEKKLWILLSFIRLKLKRTQPKIKFNGLMHC